MNIQLASFILGIVSVLVIAMSVVSVYAIVKIVKLKNDFNAHMMWAAQENERIRKDLNDRGDELDRAIDSRCDKIYEKIMKNKSPKNEVFEMTDNDGFKKSLLQVLNKEDEGNDLKNRILQLMNK